MSCKLSQRNVKHLGNSFRTLEVTWMVQRMDQLLSHGMLMPSLLRCSGMRRSLLKCHILPQLNSAIIAEGLVMLYVVNAMARVG